MTINDILNPKSPSEVHKQAEYQAEEIAKIAKRMFIEHGTPAKVAFVEARGFLDELIACQKEYIEEIYNSNVLK
jgi:hypothetical protein